MIFIIIFIIFNYYLYYFFRVVKKPKLICKDGPFRIFLQGKISLLNRKFWPTFWCVESRLQTIIAALLREKTIPKINYRRELLQLKDGGEIALDWSDKNCSINSPIIIILPGLTGASQSDYIRCLVLSAEQIEIRCVIFNNRGLGGVALKTPRAYCAANSDDLSEVIEHVRKLYPNVLIGATGISMGGLILGNYLAKEGKRTVDKIKAALLISVPLDVFKGSESIENGINLLLNRHLAKNLCQLFKQIYLSPGNEFYDESLRDVLKSKTVRQFDAAFTAKHFGYKDVDDYYKYATLHNKLHQIKVPTLFLNATDDPFQPLSDESLENMCGSENVAFFITNRGGHIGFLEGTLPTNVNQYFSELFKQYFSSIFNDNFSIAK